MSGNTYYPELAEVILDAIDLRLLELHTAMPGYIEKFDASKQLADVQPALKRAFANGKVEPLPVVTNVPVVYPRSSKFSITYPLEVGDPVLIIFSERSIDRWAAQGGIVDPADTRKHALSDAFCIPGGSPSTNPIQNVSKEHARIQFDKAVLEIQSAGKFKIKGQQEELFAIMDELFDQLINAQTAVGGLLNAPAIAALKVRFLTLKGQ